MADFLFTAFSIQQVKGGTDIVQTNGYDVLGRGAGRYISDALATAAMAAAHPRFVTATSNNRYFRAMTEGGRVLVDMSGAVGDGVADDGPAIRAAFAYASAIGARGVAFGRPRYRMESMSQSESGVATGARPSLLLPPTGGIFDFGGAELTRQDNGRGIAFAPDWAGTIVNLPLVADVAAGDTQVQLSLADAAQLAVGDTVLWQLGELPYDTPETLNWDMARVTAISAGTVKLDKPVPQGLVLSSVTGANKRLRKMPIIRDIALRDLKLTTAGVETGVEIHGGKRVTLERVGGTNLGAGLMVASYCDGVTLLDCWQEGVTVSQASFGVAFTFAECRNVTLVRPHARGLISLVTAEAGSEVAIFGGHFENTITDAQGQSLGNAVMVINAAGRGHVTVHDLTVTGHGGYRLAETSNGIDSYRGTFLFTGTLKLRHPTMPYSLPITRMNGLLDMEIAGVRELHDFLRLRHWKRRFVLADNEYLFAFGPPGILTRGEFYTAPGFTFGNGGQLSGVWLGREGDNGSNVAIGQNGQLVSGAVTPVDVFGGTVGGAMWALRNNRAQILCVTAPNAGLTNANRFIEFEGWFTTTYETGYAPTEADRLGTDEGGSVWEAVFPAYDLPSIPAGATVTVDLPIPAMQPSDYIEALRATGGLGGLTLNSIEARAGLARLVLSNLTNAAIDRPADGLAIRYGREAMGR